MNKNPVTPVRLIQTLLFAVLLVISGCSNQMAKEKHGNREKIFAAIEEGIDATASRPPEDIVAELLAVGTDTQHQPIDLEHRFDIKARRLRARDFFLSLVEGTPYDMVIHPDVGGYISLQMKGTTITEVMQTVRNIHGYDYRINGQIIEVFPNQLQTRIFQVNYLSIARSGSSTTTAGAGNSPNGGASGGNSTISTESNTNFWAELEKSLAIIVGDDKEALLSINPLTGIVMVRAQPNTLRLVEEFINQSQEILQRQVIIEARILEVELSSGFQSGINWAELQITNGPAITLAQAGGTTTPFSGSQTTALGAVTSTISSGVTGSFNLGVANSDFTTLISLLETQGDVQVLSSPRVSTVNNQKAVIKVGSDEFFVTGITAGGAATTTTEATSPTFDIDSFFSGVALDVTPQIDDNNNIVLHVHPSVSTVTEENKNVGSFTVPLAVSNVRETDSIIRAKNGQIVVIGGLMQTKTVDREGSVPGLGDIPILGALFTNTEKSRVKSELIILLKPILIDKSGSQWQQQLRKGADAMHGM